MLDLIETHDGTLLPTMPDGRSPGAWHAALTAEIAARLTPAHAALLAEPVRTETGLAWRVAGEDCRAFAELPPAGRRALATAIGVILSDIRRLGESGRAPNVAAAWPALRDVPDWKYVFAVDGRPVLAAWGHSRGAGGGGLLARLDDGVPWLPPARLPWWTYGAALGAVALLALAAGLLLPVVGKRLPGPFACVVAPGQMDLLAQQNRAADRGNELKQLLAVLDDEIGRRQLLCPISGAPRPRADLPQEGWNRRDLAMLEGCWRSTFKFPTITDSGVTGEVEQWQMCFDRSGHGHQSMKWTSGLSCEGGLQASFIGGGHLAIRDTERCHGDQNSFYMGTSECDRVDDRHANCIRTQTEGSRRGVQVKGFFLR